ncbi:MAG: DMT family transporter [Xenococcaceae cyanobacterium MO_207.B15]|nr:DMT family transporter [Xenococcaceae cyanobacterium MO_207.B15]
MTNLSNYIGELSALTAAFLWAISSVVYSLLGQRISPLQLNFLKGIIAIAFILITLLFQGITVDNFKIFSVVLLSISGIIGIGLGDTAYFLALNNLGARRTLLLETLTPPLSALLAWILIGETLNTIAWCGILLTLLGIAWVISERSALEINNNLLIVKGVMWGILAAVTQAGGSVLSRVALLNSDITPLESSLIRLVAGTGIAFLLAAIPWNQKSLSQPIKFLSFRIMGTITLAAFGSTYLGIWLQQTSLKFAPTGIAQTLLATSPIFVIPIALIMKEKVSLRSILGVLIAISGISLLFVGE